jgi:hypothetical protein
MPFGCLHDPPAEASIDRSSTTFSRRSRRSDCARSPPKSGRYARVMASRTRRIRGEGRCERPSRQAALEGRGGLSHEAVQRRHGRLPNREDRIAVRGAEGLRLPRRWCEVETPGVAVPGDKDVDDGAFRGDLHRVPIRMATSDPRTTRTPRSAMNKYAMSSGFPRRLFALALTTAHTSRKPMVVR